MRWIVGAACLLVVIFGSPTDSRAAVYELHLGGTLWGNFGQSSPWVFVPLPYEATLRIDSTTPGVIEDRYHLGSADAEPYHLGPVGTYAGAVELDLNLAGGFTFTGWQGTLVAWDFVWGEGEAYQNRLLGNRWHDGLQLSWAGEHDGAPVAITMAMGRGDVLAGVDLETALAALIASVDGTLAHAPLEVSIGSAVLGAAGGGAELLQTPIPAAAGLFLAGIAGLGLLRRRREAARTTAR